MIIEIHAIQIFPPSNLNRDRTGHPKETLFGGVRRARVSSKAIKRANRSSPVFAEAIGTPIGIRSKRPDSHVIEQLARDGIEEDWAEP